MTHEPELTREDERGRIRGGRAGGVPGSTAVNRPGKRTMVDLVVVCGLTLVSIVALSACADRNDRMQEMNELEATVCPTCPPHPVPIRVSRPNGDSIRPTMMYPWPGDDVQVINLGAGSGDSLRFCVSDERVFGGVEWRLGPREDTTLTVKRQAVHVPFFYGLYGPDDTAEICEGVSPEFKPMYSEGEGGGTTGP